MASFFRGKSDEIPLLKTNLPASTGPREVDDEEEPTPRASSPRASTPRAAAAAPKSEPKNQPQIEVIPPGERRAAMNGLDAFEVRCSVIGLIVLSAAVVALTLFLAIDKPTHIVVVRHKNTVVPLSASFILYGVADIVFCAVGAFGLVRRKRTLLSFCFILSGFALTLNAGLLGFPPIFLGCWLMWRAYRIQKYGTANSKEVAIVARTTPRQPRGQRKAPPPPPTRPSGTKAPTASKRYTPKAAPRKKVPKPTA
jgi:hypothetical protein